MEETGKLFRSSVVDRMSRQRTVTSARARQRSDGTNVWRWLAVPALLAACFFPARPAHPQDQRVLTLDADRYTIDLSADLLMRGDWISGGADLTRLTDGRVIYVPSSGADHFMVISPDGSVATQVGRSGEGPGEYRLIRWVKPYHDRLHVFDVGLMRSMVLDRHLEVVATNRLRGSNGSDVAVLGDSAYVVNAALQTSEGIGYALHLIDETGAAIRSFDGLVGGFGLPGSRRKLDRVLANTPDGRLWSAHKTQYRIDLWNPRQGTILQTLVRQAEWFQPHEVVGRSIPERPDQPRILGIELDGQGRIWVLIRVASDRWAEGFRKVGADEHPELGPYLLDDINVAYDTVLEVIDPGSGSVVGTAIADQAFFGFLGGWTVSYHELEDGTPTLQLWQMQLRESTQPVPTKRRMAK